MRCEEKPEMPKWLEQLEQAENRSFEQKYGSWVQVWQGLIHTCNNNLYSAWLENRQLVEGSATLSSGLIYQVTTKDC